MPALGRLRQENLELYLHSKFEVRLSYTSLNLRVCVCARVWAQSALGRYI